MLKKASNEVIEQLNLPFEEFRCIDLETCDLAVLPTLNIFALIVIFFVIELL